MAPHIFPRAESATNDYISAIIVASIIVAIALAYLFRLQRSNANTKRSAASLRIGVVAQPMMTETYPASKR